jgi:peptidyl-prolyl cis-trans isomerase D
MNTQSQTVNFVTFATPRINLIGVEPMVNAMAFLTEKGQMTKPFAGRNAVYVLQITDRRKSEQPFDARAQMESLNQQNSYRIVSFMQNNALLMENAKIEDNRIRFF